MLIFKSIFIISIIQLAHAFKSAFKFNQNCLSRTKSSDVDVVNRIKPDNGGKDTDKTKRLRLNLLDGIGIMTGYEAITYSILGGTVGVASVAFMLEIKKVADVNLDGCPYCMGNGEILCGCCFGTGTEGTACACHLCTGRGLVTCVNCKGDGRITPIVLQSKSVRNPDYASDDLNSGIGGA
mmetsp:Transcript_13295/g.12890  ORF Transcript_13295/g.12890 Transcript_13295/m.12890 type:complete len:181 (-) Transcript_13295:255-797(-)|eukprot:CAMPEP_0119038182 /NCGR_PEP_ID=MMETSP1177-20130426/6909_1 /TAXON_ID=2985 /ORGANISM="Ochromonas sp, Strain CCMP1899" /LENGTH=180 /DNA_ID=CAMNT_0007000371 /DNA_START=106 /DNA_END=648 /DNA_ORIENTATION=-